MTDKKTAAGKKPVGAKKDAAKKKAASDKKKSAHNRQAKRELEKKKRARRPDTRQGQTPVLQAHKPGMMEKMVMLQNNINTLTSSMGAIVGVATSGPYHDFNAVGILQEALRVQLIALRNLTAEHFDIEEKDRVKAVPVVSLKTAGEMVGIDTETTELCPTAPVFTPPGETTGGD
jgi:hypothetical protein